MTRRLRAVCPACGQQRAVDKDGRLVKHPRLTVAARAVQAGIRSAWARGRAAGLEREVCPGSGQDAGLW